MEFKVGDIVRVVRKVEPEGWNNSWESLMDNMIGKSYLVSSTNGGSVVVTGGEDGNYGFPPEALQLVIQNLPNNATMEADTPFPGSDIKEEVEGTLQDICNFLRSEDKNLKGKLIVYKEKE